MSRATFIVGDTRDVVASMPDGSVDLILTSPPFLALRSYLPADHPDKHREIGSESTPAAFIDTLLALTAEWRRVMAPHGTLALELGDTYSGSGGAGGDYSDGGLRDGQQKFRQNNLYTSGYSGGQHGLDTKKPQGGITMNGGRGWPLAKSLALIPESFRWALAYGRNPFTGQESPAGRWRVRNTVTWCRPNPPVGALGDKFRPSTSDLVIACTAGDRWFDLDAVRTEHKGDPTRPGGVYKGSLNGTDYKRWQEGETQNQSPMNPAGAPPLDHWIIPPGGYQGSHYAVFPPELCRIPVEACCPRRVCRTCGKPSRRETSTEMVGQYADRPGWMEHREAKAGGGLAGPGGDTRSETTTTGWSSCGCPDTDGIRLDGWHTGTGWRPGVVLDPFGGSGTTGLVATGRGRDALLIDLDERNAELARDRLGMFLDVVEHETEVVA